MSSGSRPRLHRLLQGYRPLSIVRHEVINLVAAILGVSVRIQRGQKCRAPLDPHSDIQRASKIAVLHPLPELDKTQPFFGFRDRGAEGDGEFVPELVGVGELIVFPMLFTSAMTTINATVRLPSKAPRSGSASPVMSSTVNTGWPSSSQMLAAIRPA